MEIVSLLYQPFEERQSFFLQVFRMPLYAHNTFILTTFHCFDRAIRSLGGSTKLSTGVGYCLMMEGIDIDPFLLIKMIQDRSLIHLNTMCWLVPTCILTMLDEVSAIVDVLPDFSA